MRLYLLEEEWASDKERRALEAAQPACSASSASLDLATRRSYNRFPMKAIRFTKTNRKMDVVEYEADSKLVARLENPKQGIIPHDLVHAIIESTLGVRGFTDLIFDGQKPEFAMKVDGEAWLAESMVEAIQGMLWSGTLDHKQFTDWVATICSQRNVPSVEISGEEFFELELKIDEMTQKWKCLEVDSALEFAWPK